MYRCVHKQKGGATVGRGSGGISATAKAVFLVACGWLAFVSAAVAMDNRDRDLSQYYHTAWTVREGAPGQITALAQTADGYLWLGTQTGLYRFDGVRFERYRPQEGGDFPASSVSALYVPPSGGLWVGFRYGVASFVQHDRATHFAAPAGLPTATIYGMAATPDGRIWAATFQGLVFMSNGRWTLVPASMGLPGVRSRNLMVDREGRLWVATDHALSYLAPGADHFEVATRAVGRVNRMAEAPDGTLWVAEADGGVRPAWAPDGKDPRSAGPSLEMPSAGLLFDRDGALWTPMLGDGLRRVPRVGDLPGRVFNAADTSIQQFVERDGLSSDNLGAVMQDREGNIWLGGSRGLDRFRVSRLLPAPLPPGATDFALVPADAHGVWVGTKNQPLTRVEAGDKNVIGFPEAITAASRNSDGVWLGGPHGLWHVIDGRPLPFASLPVDDYTGVQAIVGDGEGGAWVSLNRPGLYHYTEDSWSHDALAAVPNDPSPLILMLDHQRRLWMGFARNTVIVRDGHHDTLLGPRQGLDVGNVTALFEDGDVVWAGGALGLAVVKGNTVQAVATQGEPLRGISGLLRDHHGDFWINAAQGVVRIRSADVARMRDDARYAAPVTVFDSLDGLPGTPAQFRPLPTAVVAEDGRLWFATTSGIVSIDPDAVPRNRLAPPVSIRGMSTDAGNWPAKNSVALPARTERLSIAYTATSLTMPERVRFRYRMDGIDTHWRDAGTDREAVYTDPPPGHYVFRVSAANEDGVWNEDGASVAITIAPAYYQTLWFAALCVAFLMFLAWLAFLFRMRRLEDELRARLHERHAERERIARELHDTLLQSIQGLNMRFQAIANRIPPDEPLRISMEGALDRVEESLVEARDRVRGLRAHASETTPLDVALHELARAYGSEHTVPVLVTVDADLDGLDMQARDELFGIAREAVHNAIIHADASRIDVVVEVRGGELFLHIRDDGRGIEESVLHRGREGHWGLRGIRERAANMGGVAAFASCVVGGTEITVRVPVKSIFPARPRWWHRRPQQR